MTVEERAYEYTSRCGAGDIWDQVVEQMEAALRDQIEECAKKADKVVEVESQYSYPLGMFVTTPKGIAALMIAKEIRALAAPTESKEKGAES